MTESKRALGSNLGHLDVTTDEEIARHMVEDDAPELTDEDFARAEVWHGNKFLGHGRDFENGRRVGRPKGSGTKEMVTLRLDRDILDRFRAGGSGWQTRLNDALRQVARPRSKASGRLADTTVLVVKVLKAMPVGGTTTEIHTMVQSEGVSMARTRRALGVLANRREVALGQDGETWRYVGSA